MAITFVPWTPTLSHAAVPLYSLQCIICNAYMQNIKRKRLVDETSLEIWWRKLEMRKGSEVIDVGCRLVTVDEHGRAFAAQSRQVPGRRQETTRCRDSYRGRRYRWSLRAIDAHRQYRWKNQRVSTAATARLHGRLPTVSSTRSRSQRAPASVW